MCNFTNILAHCYKCTKCRDLWGQILTVLTASPRETTEANALVGVQQGVAATAVVAGLLGTGVVLEYGYIARAHGILLSEDGGTHQNDLGVGEKKGV